METIITYSPIPRNSPTYRIDGYGTSPHRIYCSCYAKGNKALGKLCMQI